MENKNYENPYNVENEEVLNVNEKVSASRAKKGWLIFLTIVSLVNGSWGIFLPLLDDLLEIVQHFESYMRDCYTSLRVLTPGDIIFGFIGGLLAIVGFVLGLIANKVAKKYDNPKLIIFTKIGKIVGIIGIVSNLLIGLRGLPMISQWLF